MPVFLMVFDRGAVILILGEILFDVFPSYRRVGGAPFNFAFHLKQFGLPVRFVTRIGSDPEGRDLSAFLTRHGFSPRDVQRDLSHPTGRVDVTLDDRGVPTFSIARETAYDHLHYEPALSDALSSGVEMIYFGSLAQRHPQARKTICRVLDARAADVSCLYDVNLRPGCYTSDIIVSSLEHSDLVKLNGEELRVLGGIFGVEGGEEVLISFLMEEFDLRMLCVTRGEQGSELYTPQKCVRAPVHVPGRLVDTVGAGDAFAAMLALGYLREWAPEKIVTLAGEFAGEVCGIAGTLPEDPRFYDRFRQLMMNEEPHGSS